MAFERAADKGSAYRYGGAALFISAASILTALGFQYIGGYQPCMLCFMERYAYYAALPLLFVAITLSSGGYKGWAAALFFLVAMGYLANAGLGTYHAGAEWKFWPGPETCGGAAPATSAGTLLKDLEGVKIVRCDEPALVFLGLSFAGWNVVGSLLLMALSLNAAFAASASRSQA